MSQFLKRLLSSLILIPFVLFIIIKGEYFFNFFIIVCLIFIFYEWYIMVKNKLIFLLGLIYFIFSFYSVYELRNTFEYDYLYFLIVTIICVLTDIGGYIFGKLFKGPKLVKISPNKTYSGMFGSYFLSIIGVFIFLENNILIFNFVFSLNVLIFIIFISTISQIGDITISYFKRLNNFKDTGNLIPGHGGILDRVDGLIFAYPFAFLVLKFNLINLFK